MNGNAIIKLKLTIYPKFKEVIKMKITDILADSILIPNPTNEPIFGADYFINGHLKGRTFIKSFDPDIDKTTNNVLLFLNDELIIEGYQISKFSPDKGLQTLIK